jgi:hypothetical protein
MRPPMGGLTVEEKADFAKLYEMLKAAKIGRS